MQCQIIRSSDLTKFNRMDATFFVTAKPLESRAKELEGMYTKQDIITLLDAFTVAELQPLSSLSRNNAVRITEAAIVATIDEYPYLSLALMERRVTSILTKRQESMDAMQDELTTIKSIRELQL